MEPPSGLTLPAVLREKAQAQPSHPAVLYRGETRTYAELDRSVERAAKAFLAQGVQPGDRIGVLLGNEPEWLVLCLATAMIGATFVPLNTWYKQTELAWTLRHARLRVLVAASRFLKADYAMLLNTIIPELPLSRPSKLQAAAFPALRTIILIGPRVPGALSYIEFLAEADGVPQAELDAAQAAVSPDSAAFVLYTSGSTAEPKGVLLNHRGVVQNGFELGARRAIESADRVWLGSPLFYGLGATNALPATLTAGATLVLQGAFDAGEAISVIQRTASTVFYGTGNMTRAMLDHPDYAQRRIGSLQKGNAGTMAEYKRLTLVEMGITSAVPAYGLTESYGNATVGLPDDPLDVKLATSGTALPGFEIRIVDPTTGRTLARNETGLILLRGHTTPGYLDNPAETQKALRPDGFFDTGDLGSLDAEGRLVFHARLKEVIKTGGINVSPMEVEQLLAAHPDVRDAYVIGVTNAAGAELVVAFVDRSASIAADTLRDYVRERAASFKTPHHVFFRTEDELPRMASGKVAKHRLVEEARKELGLPQR